MDGNFDDIELLFIREVLDQHGEYLADLFHESIESKGLIDTEALNDSIQYKVTSYGNNPVLQFNFYGYGRAIEIRWFKRSSNTQKWVTDTNKEVWGAGQRRKRRKKDTRWYARNLFGSQNRLIRMLLYELTDQERTRLKNILDHQQMRLI